jgi:hypothetical protein
VRTCATQHQIQTTVNRTRSLLPTRRRTTHTTTLCGCARHHGCDDSWSVRGHEGGFVWPFTVRIFSFFFVPFFSHSPLPHGVPRPSNYPHPSSLKPRESMPAAHTNHMAAALTVARTANDELGFGPVTKISFFCSFFPVSFLTGFLPLPLEPARPSGICKKSRRFRAPPSRPVTHTCRGWRARTHFTWRQPHHCPDNNPDGDTKTMATRQQPPST